MIYQIEPQHLNDSILETYIYPAIEQRYYWTDSWEPHFYKSLAYAGFICVAAQEEGTVFLLPEIQEKYAILDWSRVHMGRQISRLVRTQALERNNVRLRFSHDTTAVIQGIRDCYGEQCWIREPYAELLAALSADRSETFSLLAVELYSDVIEAEQVVSRPVLIAGELGYTIGKTYTSLSGFLRREQKGSNNMGTVQLLALARVLERCGYAFWNLGHPYMPYKFGIGAEVLPRADFLARWKAARGWPVTEPLSGLVNRDFSCQELLSR